jgi:hypothetical protein
MLNFDVSGDHYEEPREVNFWTLYSETYQLRSAFNSGGTEGGPLPSEAKLRVTGSTRIVRQ